MDVNICIPDNSVDADACTAALASNGLGTAADTLDFKCVIRDSAVGCMEALKAGSAHFVRFGGKWE